MIRQAASLGILFILFCPPASGHHSLEATYFMDRRITVEGALVKVELGGAHSHVYVETRDANGRTSQWLAEWVDAKALVCQGVDATVLKAGDKVRVAGAPVRDPAKQRLLIESITRPSDGWTAKGLKDSWNDIAACPAPTRSAPAK